MIAFSKSSSSRLATVAKFIADPMNTFPPERHALRAGFTIEEIFGLTKIDRWFLVQIKEIVDFEDELATAKN